MCMCGMVWRDVYCPFIIFLINLFKYFACTKTNLLTTIRGHWADQLWEYYRSTALEYLNLFIIFHWDAEDLFMETSVHVTIIHHHYYYYYRYQCTHTHTHTPVRIWKEWMIPTIIIIIVNSNVPTSANTRTQTHAQTFPSAIQNRCKCTAVHCN